MKSWRCCIHSISTTSHHAVIIPTFLYLCVSTDHAESSSHVIRMAYSAEPHKSRPFDRHHRFSPSVNAEAQAYEGCKGVFWPSWGYAGRTDRCEVCLFIPKSPDMKESQSAIPMLKKPVARPFQRRYAVRIIKAHIYTAPSRQKHRPSSSQSHPSTAPNPAPSPQTPAPA
jgi:hypothetical protein